MIEQDFWGRYTSSSTGTEAKVYTDSVDLRFIDSGRTVHYTAHRFQHKSAIRWEAYIVPGGALPPEHITFTKYKLLGQEEETTAVEWPDIHVGKLVMVERYTHNPDEPRDMTPIISILSLINIGLVLFDK